MKKVVRETVLLCSYDKVPKARRDNARGHISRVYTVYTEKTLIKETQSYKQFLIIDHLQIILPNIAKLK